MRFSGCPACPGIFCLASTAICQTSAGIGGLGSLSVGLCHLQCPWGFQLILCPVLHPAGMRRRYCSFFHCLCLSGPKISAIESINFTVCVHLGPKYLLLRALTLTTQCKGNWGTRFWIVDSLQKLMHPAFGHGSSEGRSSYSLSEAASRCLRPI